MSGIVDTYITYRIVTTLVKPWKEQEAYEYGISVYSENFTKIVILEENYFFT